MKIAVFVPTYNAGALWDAWLDCVDGQSVRFSRRLLIDSSSSDDTLEKARARGWEGVCITQAEFDHGGTRQQGIERLEDMDIVVFLTQDALLADPTSVETLLSPLLNNPQVASVYGRQLPHQGASEVAAQHRAFNYPPLDALYTLDDLRQQGLRAAFASDSFAAYRVSAVQAVGGFSRKIIFAEDMQLVVRLLQAGWQHAYAGTAEVYHSHDYTYAQEMRRCFDMGVFHRTHRALLSPFQGPGVEAKRLLLSEACRHIRAKSFTGFVDFLLRNTARMLGYTLARAHSVMPKPCVKALSMNRAYWS